MSREPPAKRAEELPFNMDAMSLVGRAVRGARPKRGRVKEPRWVAVAGVFGLGSTYSMELCRHFGLDPGELVKR